MPMELSGRDLQRRAEYRRELDEQFERKKHKNGAEALEALRDLFESQEELDAFGRYIRRKREEESTQVAFRPDSPVLTNDISIVFATAGELWKWG
jgi:hypothetical protein